ncbi:MAG: HU family DNA-binding protein [Gammaproteobacteria bacterium]|nr:HU family DNA-binding protein [Gammaproteobacteria bacterium]
MNKTELIEAVVEKVALPKKQVAQVLEAIMETITNQLSEDNSVVLVGFGTFLVKKRAARKGVNPKTGDVIDIKAANVPGFKSGKSLKEACNLVLETVD